MVIDGFMSQTDGLRGPSTHTCCHACILSDINCHLFQVVSLPVILTSQTSQEIMAKGTLIWDAAFSEQVTVVTLTDNFFFNNHIMIYNTAKFSAAYIYKCLLNSVIRLVLNRQFLAAGFSLTIIFFNSHNRTGHPP